MAGSSTGRFLCLTSWKSQHRAQENRPELIVARRQLEEAQLLLKLAQAQNKLSVDLDARYGYSVRDPKNCSCTTSAGGR